MTELRQEPPGGADRDSLLRIEIFGPAEPAKASQPRQETRLGPTEQAHPAAAESEAPASAHHARSSRDATFAALEEEMERRKAELERRERALTGSEGLVEAGTAEVERRERKLAQMEQAIQDRTRELDERELVVERREIELEGAFGLREDRIETRETELAELEDRLRRKEEDLARYVGQLQAQLIQRS